jgi:DNA-binding response OmpR family regulator
MRVLLVEDNQRLAESISKGLARSGFGVDAFSTAADGTIAFESMGYEAVILDLGLPDRDGLEMLRELRQINAAVPILILTARDSIEDRVAGLNAGADDYVIKPFAMVELAARLRALLRRPSHPIDTVLTIGNLRLDVSARQVTVNGSTLRFSARETEMLEMLMRREGLVISKRSLEDGLYGLHRHVSPNSIEVLISRLRRRLKATKAACAILTLHGIGYLLKEKML